MGRYSETSSDVVLASSNTAVTSVKWPGGRGVFMALASAWGTATLQFQMPDGSTWVDVGSDTTLSATGAGGFELHPCDIRVSLSGTTAASAWVKGTGVS